jgi:hypothetical protein
VVVDVPPVQVIPLENIKLPYIFLEPLDKVPVNPVKFNDLQAVVRTTISEPADILKLGWLDSAIPEAFTIVLVPVLPEYVQFTTAVPVVVNPVEVLVVQIVALLPVSVILPVPNVIARVLELDELNIPVLNT